MIVTSRVPRIADLPRHLSPIRRIAVRQSAAHVIADLPSGMCVQSHLSLMAALRLLCLSFFGERVILSCRAGSVRWRPGASRALSSSARTSGQVSPAPSRSQVVATLDDGQVRLRLAAPSAATIAEQLAGWGDRVEVIERDSVRTDLARIGHQLVDRYFTRWNPDKAKQRAIDRGCVFRAAVGLRVWRGRHHRSGLSHGLPQCRQVGGAGW